MNLLKWRTIYEKVHPLRPHRHDSKNSGVNVVILYETVPYMNRPFLSIHEKHFSPNFLNIIDYPVPRK